jgi:hypothetical protein
MNAMLEPRIVAARIQRPEEPLATRADYGTRRNDAGPLLPRREERADPERIRRDAYWPESGYGAEGAGDWY